MKVLQNTQQAAADKLDLKAKLLIIINFDENWLASYSLCNLVWTGDSDALTLVLVKITEKVSD